MKTTPLPDDFDLRLERLQQRVRGLHDAIGSCVPYSGAQPVSPFINGFVERLYQDARALLPPDSFEDLAALMTATPAAARTLLDASAMLAVVRAAIEALTPNEEFGFNR
jgi:hypothetical protein